MTSIIHPKAAAGCVAASFPPFIAGQSAARVDESLRQALAVADSAQECAVLWFGEVARRSLFRDLGYASLELYANERLGFSHNRFCQFQRLAGDLERLPILRAAVACGRIGWTKAQQVARVATPASEAAWVDKAARTGRREFADAVKAARARARAHAQARRRWPAGESGAQLALPVAGKDAAVDAPAADDAAVDAAANRATAACAPHADLAADPPTTVSFRLDGLQLARFEALCERIRKRGLIPRGASREEVLLAALESLAEEGPVPAAAAAKGAVHPIEFTNQHLQDPENRNFTALRRRNGSAQDGVRRDSRPPVQIVVRRCPDCERVAAVTGHGDRALPPAAADAVMCDARVFEEGHRSRATIPPAVRAAVLARDGHRCRTPGCRSTRFLEVHHIVPRSEGGSNRKENLITLCGRCHRFAHERSMWRQEPPPAHPDAQI